jgi:hypothetical protein
MSDPESAAMISKELVDKPSKPTTLGWTAELNLLATIVDVLSEVHATLIQINSEGHKRPTVAHVPRPVSVIDRIESKLAIAEHKKRVQAWLGKDPEER